MAKRLLTATSLAIAASFGGGQAWALGFGPVRASATMGQPLDVSVALRLLPGETVTDACLSASVVSGDVPIASGFISTSFINPVGGEPRVRVRTSTRIDEPFVTVTVNITCEGRLTRQFTVFADPPSPNPVLEPGSGVSTASAPAAAAEPAPSPVGTVTAGGAVAPSRSTARASSGVIQAPKRERPAGTAVAVSRAQVAAAAPVSAAPAAKVEPNEPVRVSGGAVTPVDGGARLRLDAPIVNTANDQAYARAMQQREEALATAKIAVDVAQAANNSAAQKVASVESALAAARKETAEAKAALDRLRAARNEADTFGGMAPWLAAACLALLGLAGYLFVRLRRVDSERLKGWLNEPGQHTRQSEFDTVSPATEQFHPDATPVAAKANAANTGYRQSEEEAEPSVLAPLPPLPATGTTFTDSQPSSSFEIEQAATSHDISIEELLDVEQQAEFFVVLGQDDAAIDLLTSHVMSSGGASPMPYLKLLEIYRRIGDQTSYERTRKRFNARFNGVAPDWMADPNGGRTLDEYPEVMQRIQDAWVRPMDAMAELQTLMFRNDSNLLFELPAYRDIMMLFTLSRDRHDEFGEDQVPVDVLLPLHAQVGNAAGGEVRFGPTGEDSLEADLRFALDVGDRSAAASRR